MYLEPTKDDDLMAAELIDLRTKIPAECHAVLSGLSQATGDDIAVIARQALIEYAKKQQHIATVVYRVTRSEGGDGARSGKGGAS